ncbi:hypothetical protein M0R45_018337 [Rubus argutus]|uniref:Uncharacterized protein n=1 Tax=Rubus argutus TaxID=59490 RepID=A0AAW1X3Z6_RUBAR
MASETHCGIVCKSVKHFWISCCVGGFHVGKDDLLGGGCCFGAAGTRIDGVVGVDGVDGFGVDGGDCFGVDGGDCFGVDGGDCFGVDHHGTG